MPVERRGRALSVERVQLSLLSRQTAQPLVGRATPIQGSRCELPKEAPQRTRGREALLQIGVICQLHPHLPTQQAAPGITSPGQRAGVGFGDAGTGTGAGWCCLQALVNTKHRASSHSHQRAQLDAILTQQLLLR
eukprot:COSAG01_NODE_25044_length_757_cov_1.537994_2_plen_134_part_01